MLEQLQQRTSHLDTLQHLCLVDIVVAGIDDRDCVWVALLSRADGGPEDTFAATACVAAFRQPWPSHSQAQEPLPERMKEAYHSVETMLSAFSACAPASATVDFLPLVVQCGCLVLLISVILLSFEICTGDEELPSLLCLLAEVPSQGATTEGKCEWEKRQRQQGGHYGGSVEYHCLDKDRRPSGYCSSMILKHACVLTLSPQLTSEGPWGR